MPKQQFNPEQLKAITHGDGPLLIIAGAGTGKTTVITKRIEHLITQKNVSPSNILALTFTEKAAQEMETRVDEILPFGYTQMWIETFHAFCDRILRQEAIHIGLNPKYDLMTEADALLFLRRRIFDFELEYFRPLGNPTKFLQGMLQHFSRLKDDDITPEQYVAYANGMNDDDDERKQTKELALAFKKYEELKAQEGVMDFSDLISNVLLLFRKRKHILTKYQELFHYVLVDEFQDTNYAQNELAMLLSGDKQNITVVGDDDQSIYRWRGAAISNMLQFRSHFPTATIVTLNKNYRSSQEILDGAYQMIQANNPDRLEIKEGIDKKLTAMRNAHVQDNSGIEFIFTQRGEEEAEIVAKKIHEEIIKMNRPFNEFAILVRANDHATPFQRALDRAKIPYQFLGPGHLFEQEEIKDLVAYLHALANFEDTSSLYRVITMPIFDIAARDIAALLTYAKKQNMSLFEAMEQVAQSPVTTVGQMKVSRILKMLHKHLELVPRETAGQILYYFFEDSGLLGYYLDPQTIRTEQEAENVAKFFDKLQSFTSNNTDASVFAVTDWIDLAMELGESPMSAEVDWSRNNAVNILTIHSSKGLEFPVVFVVNLVNQRFPSRDRKEQIPVPQAIIRETLPQGNENLQEERRLFYVAMTRAKEKLFLTASRFYGDGKRARKISPFVMEALGDAAVETVVTQQSYTDPGEQLSLLDMFNANIQEQNKKETLPENKQTLTPITYVSYSQLQTFQTCPLHYKLKYLLKVPTHPTPALSYGVSVHNTLRDFSEMMRENGIVSPNSIAQLLETNWNKQGYESKKHEQQAYKQAEEMITMIAKQLIIEQPQTIGIELPFTFSLDDLKVGGKIDRIDDLGNGKIEIIDYKTGPKVPTTKKVKENFQLSFYALAATETHDGILNKQPEEIILTLHYLQANKKLSTTRSATDLVLAKEKIKTLVKEISQSNFRCIGGRVCKECEYKMVCQSFS